VVVENPRIAEIGFAELQRHSAGLWFDPRFGDERVPRLAEVYALARDRAAINVEIKAEPGRAVETARAALAVAREAGALGRSLFSCFEPEPLEALRGEGAPIRLALLTGPASLGTLYEFGSAQAARAVMERMERWRHLAPEAACVHRTLVSGRLTDDLHARRWAVLVYTVDEEASAERLEAMGVVGSSPAPAVSGAGRRSLANAFVGTAAHAIMSGIQSTGF
jgi:glycerophosphoryl diester phosphodiesterase